MIALFLALGLAIIGTFLGWLIIPSIVDQISALGKAVPGYVNDIQHSNTAQEVNDRLHLTDKLFENLQQLIDKRTITSVFERSDRRRGIRRRPPRGIHSTAAC